MHATLDIDDERHPSCLETLTLKVPKLLARSMCPIGWWCLGCSLVYDYGTTSNAVTALQAPSSLSIRLDHIQIISSPNS